MAKLETLKRVLLYLSAPVAVAAATKARQLLDPMLQDTSIFLAYVPAVALVAWLAGGGPGVVAMVLSAITAVHLSRFHSPPGEYTREVIGSVFFVLSCVAIIWIVEAQRKAKERAEAAQKAQQEAVEMLAERENRLRTVFDSAHDVAIVVMDTSRTIREWSLGAARITGWTAGEVIGKSADLIFFPEDIELGAPDKEQVIAETTGHAPDTRWHRKKSGGKFYAQGMMRPIKNSQGDITGFVKVFTDITPQIEAKEEMERRVADRTQELESLSYSMAHDMRQYVRGISVNAAQLAEDLGDRLSVDDKRALRRLETNAKQIYDMVEGILNHLRLGRAEIMPRSVDLSRLAAEVAEKVRVGCPNPDVRFAVEPDLWAKGDPDLVTLVLNNLFENACSYGSGEVRFGFDRQKQAYFVRDEGPGFEPEFAERIFRPFERLHGQDKPGTGIGLPNARRIIERHGGRMWAESDGRGAIFYFTLGQATAAVPTASIHMT